MVFLADRDFVSPKDARLGCDFAGTVDHISEGVENVKIGDRVAGFVHGGRWQDIGSFAGESEKESALHNFTADKSVVCRVRQD